MNFQHRPVLLEECIYYLNIKPDGTYLDGTIGGAGHSAEIYGRLGENGMLIGIDQDVQAIEASEQRLRNMDGQARFILENTNFKYMKDVCSKYGIEKVDGILLDIGVSSYQLDEGDRGFSYQQDAPLDMRMDRRQPLNASIIVNEYNEQDIRKIISEYGEEKWAARIAEFIVKERRKKRIDTTHELVSIIKAAIPSSARREGPHPAKRTFQALRIAVNDELGALKKAVEDGFSLLKPGGRMCIITFHSLEDKIVKSLFAAKVKPCTCPPEFPACVCGRKPEGELVTKKPVLPSEIEVKENPRARSAKLRVIQRKAADRFV